MHEASIPVRYDSIPMRHDGISARHDSIALRQGSISWRNDSLLRDSVGGAFEVVCSRDLDVTQIG
eukprot:CAMPEP_0179418092 /NCGR_PEP_ID=MMETSP0799-20121207/7762_1 /TAXON_ID=46947 /ORGANISM="Geminigera cryophila, Strain CCMP2564" /LENGTH=64 /DNA_ID=CAMNT_0021191237 /DNA_START=548 /DNA_END=742 /DNA_ORIENTATION=+